MATIEEALQSAISQLAESESPRLDAELLLRHVTGLDASSLITRNTQPLSDSESEQFSELLERRKNGEPIAHLIGYREFWSLSLNVNRHSLIPRPDTELLVELALDLIDRHTLASVIDLGTGTGAIAIAVKKERPHCDVTATDNSIDALLVAQKNANQHQVKLNLVQSRWFDQLAANSYDLIISNPPYIAETDPHLQRGDVRFEPRAALAAGADGLDAIREIVRWAPTHLSENGWLLLEHGYRQAAQVRAIMATQDFTDIETRQDLAGNDRVTLGRKQ